MACITQASDQRHASQGVLTSVSHLRYLTYYCLRRRWVSRVKDDATLCARRKGRWKSYTSKAVLKQPGFETSSIGDDAQNYHSSYSRSASSTTWLWHAASGQTGECSEESTDYLRSIAVDLLSTASLIASTIHSAVLPHLAHIIAFLSDFVPHSASRPRHATWLISNKVNSLAQAQHPIYIYI